MWNPAISPYQRAVAEPTAPCLADETRSWTTTDVAERVEATAVRLRALGVGPGAVVALMMTNRLELIISLFAAWRLRAVVTPINPAFTATEAGFQLADSGARVVVVDGALRTRIEASAATVPVVAAEELERLPRRPVWGVPLAPTGLALLIYTSGTTGRPKGVMLSHANLQAMIESMITAAQLSARDHSLLVLPLFHVNGLVVGTLAPLAAGSQVSVGPRFDPATFWDVVARCTPTYFSAVPTMYLMLLASPAVPRDVSSLRLAFCGAAPMPRDAIGEVERRFGVALLEGYGLSEATVASTLNPLDGPRKPGTVGPPVPGQEVLILGGDDRPLPRGERGEVGIIGPTVMLGYWNRPDETASALRNGILHTGDVGFLDHDGYLVLVDRSKDMIIRGGENIYPKEIETVLHRHPDGEELVTAIGPSATFVRLDVTRPDDWAAAVATATRTYGALHVLVNNAGIPSYGPIDQSSRADWDKVIAVNLTGVFNGITAVIPALKAAGGGSIINISSMAGMRGEAGMPSYVASKWGVRGLTKAAALDLARYGIRVNSIHPGIVETPLSQDGPRVNMSHVAMNRIGKPVEIANLAVFLASKESSFSTGAEFVADGGELAGIIRQ